MTIIIIAYISIMSDTPEPNKQYRLTTKNLFNHFMLVHDFLLKFTKTPAPNNLYFDAQLDVQKTMNAATLNGSRFGQGSTLLGLIVYCVRSYNIPMKFAFGFLYVYWTNHFYTLGSYLGVLVQMPQAYRRVGDYYQAMPAAKPNLLDIM